MERRPKYFFEIKSKIKSMENGAVFTASDFSDIAGVDVINKALSRMCEDGSIRRIMQGVYDKPEYSRLLDEYSAPRIDKTAEALARKYNWTIAPSGDAVLNMFHISTQVPNTWEYASNGPFREYRIGTTNLKFNRRASKDSIGKSYITLATAEALKAVGKNRIDENIISRIRIAIPENEKGILLDESKTMTSWVKENIRKICEVQDA